MIYINAIFLLFFALLLLKDYSLTKGKFTKAKIFHAIAILFVFYFYSSCWKGLYLVFNTNKLDLVFNKDYGFFSSTFMKFDYVINCSLGAVATIAAFGLLTRNVLSRKILLNLLPFLILTTSLMAYKETIAKGNNQLNDYVLLFSHLITTTIFLGWIFILYKLKFMIKFFEDKTNK